MNTPYAVTLSLVSSKGGVGKSTWAINGACAFADMGLRVLCVDLDPQQSLSKFFCKPQDIGSGSGLYEFLTLGDLSAIRPTHFSGVSVIVNNDESERLNLWLAEQFSAAFTLKNMLARVRDRYDIIIIDTQGKDGRGQLQELALVASDIVIVPTTPDLISAQELPRVIQIYTTETRNAIASIRKNFGAIARHIAVLRATIPHRVVWRQCISERRPAHRIEYGRDDARNALPVMEAVIHELLPHYGDLTLDSLCKAKGGSNVH